MPRVQLAQVRSLDVVAATLTYCPAAQVTASVVQLTALVVVEKSVFRVQLAHVRSLDAVAGTLTYCPATQVTASVVQLTALVVVE